MPLITTGDGRFEKQIPEDESHFNKLSLFLFNRSVLFCDPLDCSPPSLLCPWDFPGKNTGVGCHFLLKGIFLTQGLNSGLLLGR